jgi:hypothetical protein
MLRQVRSVVAVGIVFGALILLGSNADAGPRRRPRIVRMVHDESFSVTGEFTGELSGTVILNGSVFQLSDKATLCEVGRPGTLPRGAFVSGRRVVFTGVQRGGTRIVQSVIVRPSGGGSYGAEPSRNVGVLGTKVPR